MYVCVCALFLTVIELFTSKIFIQSGTDRYRFKHRNFLFASMKFRLLVLRAHLSITLNEKIDILITRKRQVYLPSREHHLIQKTSRDATAQKTSRQRCQKSSRSDDTKSRVAYVPHEALMSIRIGGRDSRKKIFQCKYIFTQFYC